MSSARVNLSRSTLAGRMPQIRSGRLTTDLWIVLAHDIKLGQFSPLFFIIMPATLTAPYTLTWDSYSQWAPKDDEISGIYSNYVHFYAVGDVKFEVSFRVGEGRQLGLLFVDVVMSESGEYDHKMHYCLGQFYKNSGAKLFAQFALNHFIETETWSVCPSFQPVDYIDGEPCTLGGDEIVSELI
jgi:hypothetical protein